MNEFCNKIDEITRSERRIHTPSSFARNNLNFVQEIGQLKSLRAHSCIRENLESYLFFVILSGCGTVSTAGKIYEVKSGDCIFLDCRKHYEHKSSEEDPWEIAWVHFNGKEATSLYPLFLEGNYNSPIFHPEKGITYFCDLMEQLNVLQEKRQVLAEVEASQLLSRLMFDCLKEVVKDGKLTLDHIGRELEHQDFDNLRESVNEHITEPGLLRTLAVQYGLEPERLNAVFQDKYGITLDAYITNRKFNKAKEMLRFTIKTVEEIAAESGMGNEELLRDMLLEQEGMSPEDYRKKWAQWIKS